MTTKTQRFLPDPATISIARKEREGRVMVIAYRFTSENGPGAMAFYRDIRDFDRSDAEWIDAIMAERRDMIAHPSDLTDEDFNAYGEIDF